MSMTGKLIAIMALASIAMSGGGMMADPSSRRGNGEFETEEDKYPNHHKKCFRSACKNNRQGNKLYCSAECCKLHKTEKQMVRKVFESPLGQQLEYVFVTSDNRAFIRHDEAVLHTKGLLDDDTLPLEDATITEWDAKWV